MKSKLSDNLFEIKSTTKALARCVEPTVSDINLPFPLMNSHPFLQDVIWYSKMMEDKVTINENNISQYCFTTPEVYKEWLKQFDSTVDSADNITAIYMMYRAPYKLAFMKFNGEFMSEKNYAEFLADAWVTEENPNMDINVPIEESVEMFQRAEKKWLMVEKDYKYYRNLPDKIEVYRGVSIGRLKYGLSWTDDKETAEWFKKRFEKYGDGENKCTILKAVVDKKDVLAYFNTRNEKELVVNVLNIMDKIEEIE